MCPFNMRLRPQLVATFAGAGGGRPTKSSKGGRKRESGAVGSGSHMSMDAPAASSRQASDVYKRQSSRVGSLELRAVVSYEISSEASAMISSRASRTAVTTFSSRESRGSTVGIASSWCMCMYTTTRTYHWDVVVSKLGAVRVAIWYACRRSPVEIVMGLDEVWLVTGSSA